MTKVHYIIVGQGIAGTMLHYFLAKSGKKILVIDDEHQTSASKVAAGLVNPITGRKFLKSWRIETFLPFAFRTYQEIGEKLNIATFKRQNILRALRTIKDENIWHARSANEAVLPYYINTPDTKELENKIDPALSYVEVTQSMQVFLPEIIKKYRAYLQDQKALMTEQIDYGAIEISSSNITYKDIKADRIIFCEGYKIVNNPYFQDLPFENAKGEVLLVRIPDASFKKIIKQKIFIINLYEDIYWVGSGYEWDFEDHLPTEKGKEKLIKLLEDVLLLPYEIVDHQAAVRPCTRQRRPIIGRHPSLSNVYVFNGFGTKGASLTPYWAAHMTSFLEKDTALDTEVDVNRFKLEKFNQKD